MYTKCAKLLLNEIILIFDRWVGKEKGESNDSPFVAM